MRAGRLLMPVCMAVIVVSIVLSARAMTRSSFADAEAPTVLVPPAPPPVTDRVRGDSLARRIAERNPFRAHRTPAALRFDPMAGAGAAPQPRPSRAQLSVVGLFLGTDSAALLDGLPGTEASRALRVGERLGEYLLVRVTPDQAVVAGPDTVYTLRLRSRSP